jgi:hypothetical protein
MSDTGPERGIWLRDDSSRNDLAVFAERARVLDEAAVVRLRNRSDGLLGVWAHTGFDVLAGRAVAGVARPADISCAADQLTRALRSVDATGYVDPGFPMDSAWRGALPAESGFVHLDDVPATIVQDLARQGAEASRDAGGHGPPAGLLDQNVLRVSSEADEVGVPLRCALALAAMRFIPENHPAAEVVRVRVSPAWLRIDARFGSVFRRRESTLLLA